jgi:hypothetical protein
MTPGQLSGDGKWQWDGSQWVPAPPGQAPAMVPSGLNPPTALVSIPPTNSLAVVSLVAAILSWVLCPVVAGVIAIITGHIARGQIRRTGEGGNAVALAALIIGYVHLAAWAIGLSLWLVLLGGFAWLAAAGSH